MNNRNQQPVRPVQQPLPVQSERSSAATHLNVFTVEEYKSNGKTGKRWTKVGAAFPHKESGIQHRAKRNPSRWPPGRPAPGSGGES